jgi:glutamyl-tRNA synthetase
LRWLGLDWDGEAVVQTQRLARYESALSALRQRELIYPCTCSRADVDNAASAPHAEHEGPAYPGICAGRSAADAANLGPLPYAWRFRSQRGTWDFLDGFRGPVQLEDKEIGGDFVIWKSAGTPAYQLAVVVDDADMGITEVIRGDDLLPSTPRQLQIYRALGLKTPHFVHVPLVVGPDGRRLAKRHGDTRLLALRQAGVRAETLIGLLAFSCGWLDHPAPVTSRELIPRFRLETIAKEPFVLSELHLRSIGYES